jgi:chromosome segregation ATPase
MAKRPPLQAKADVAFHQAVAAGKARLVDLETTMRLAVERIDKLEEQKYARLDELGRKLYAIEDDVKRWHQLGAKINHNDRRVDGLQERVKAAETRVAADGEIIVTLKERLDHAERWIGGAMERFAALEAAVAKLLEAQEHARGDGYPGPTIDDGAAQK